MGAPFSNLLSKLEEAAKTYLNAIPVGVGFTFHGQSRAATKTSPCIILEAASMQEEDPPYSGNFWVNFEIVVKSAAPVDTDGVDTKAPNDILVATVFDAFLLDTTPAGLSANGVDFTCMAVLREGMNFTTEEEEWVNTLRLRVYCCASTLAP